LRDGDLGVWWKLLALDFERGVSGVKEADLEADVDTGLKSGERVSMLRESDCDGGFESKPASRLTA